MEQSITAAEISIEIQTENEIQKENLLNIQQKNTWPPAGSDNNHAMSQGGG